MKVGINLLLWTANPSFREHESLLEDLSGWGFDAFEIGVSGLSSAEISKFAKKADELGLDRTVLDVFLAAEADTISEDPEKRNKAVEIVKDSIRKTVDIGATVFSGPIYQGLVNTTQTGPSEDEWNRAVDALRECALFAKEQGVKIAAEPLNRFEAYLVTSVDQAYRFAMDVGVDSFGILADTHHSNIEEYDTAASWSKVMDRIYNVHISENNRGIPGEGHAIPPEVFAALQNGGYDGYLTIEAFNANVPEIAPLLRLWRSFVDDESIIAKKGLEFIRSHV
ncbi:MAG: sugar phosphate isomerase/epimerase family protein [Alkalispirochaeta sp.]